MSITYQEHRKRGIRKKLNSLLVIAGLSLGLFMYTRVEAVIIPRYRAKISNNLAKARFTHLNKAISYNGGNSSILGAGTQDAQSIAVLTYHGIVEEENGAEDVSWDNFKDQMFMLKNNGYETVTFKQLDDFLTEGKPLPQRSFLLTFDDGRKDSYYPVDPILKELNYKAIMFVIMGRVSDKDNFHLTKSELKGMLSTGRWDLESHSENAHKLDVIGSNGEMGHWLANKLWLKDLNRLESDGEYRKRVTDDLIEAKEDLDTTFGINVKAFAFPYGDYGQDDTNYPDSEQVILGVARSNYKFGFYQPWGENGDRNYPGKDTFMIRRITVGKTTSPENLLKKIQAGEDKEIGYSDLFEKDNGWITRWGETDISAGNLLLRSTEQTSGAKTNLNGTELWGNYEVVVKVVLGKDTDSFSVIAREDRFGNYSYCNFGRYGVSYNEKVDGQIVTGNRWNKDIKYLMSNEVEVGVRIEGDKTTCLMNRGTMVKDRNIKITQNEGMIGFSIWSSKANAQAQIFSFESKPTTYPTQN